MKSYKLLSEKELALLEKIENGEYVSLSKAEFEKEKALLQQAAMNTIEKRKKVIISGFLRMMSRP
ncbi:hypothetical protein [Sulfurovum riftiae]|nr:hypothetical protein [Sulfurovum riftiae]